MLERILSICLRIGELAFAAVVAGLSGEYLHVVHSSPDWSKKRFIYTEVIAALSILLALFWLIPFSGGFIHWPVDVLLSVGWFVAFGLLVKFIGPLQCGSIWNWSNLTEKSQCEKWKADIAFIFLSAIFWLVSALVGIWFVYRHKHTRSSDAALGRRRWYRRHRV